MTYCNCGELSKYKDPFTPHPQNYCPTCFSNHLEKKMTRGFPRNTRGQPITVAVSGGKDSITLLEVILKAQKVLKIPSVKAIFLEEQIPEIRLQRQRVIKSFSRKYPHLEILYKDYTSIYGYSLPELVKKSIKKKLRFTPCMMCGILKKNALFKIGLQLKTSYIALGTTLEDEAATILLNIIRGRPQSGSIKKLNESDQVDPSYPQLLKPLARISEDLIQTYVDINNLPTISEACPYAGQSIRSDLTALLEKLKKRDPRGSLLFNITKQKHIINKQKSNLIKCRQCQAPSDQSLCSACRILAQLK